MLVKIWLEADCRRFTQDKADITFEGVHEKASSLFQLELDAFIIKYKDPEGDMVTVASPVDLNDILRNDFPSGEGTLKLHVYPTAMSATPPSALGARPSRPGGMVQGGYDEPVTSSEQTTPDGAKVDRFDTRVTDREVLEILRDISYYISSRGEEADLSRVGLKDE
ncbi:hypothetical protein HDV00_004192 [Rhizophlyctis rosea]|nr:hypothetical protein HDV00_004192 [Rhizophlyctis rosea]